MVSSSSSFFNNDLSTASAVSDVNNPVNTLNLPIYNSTNASTVATAVSTASAISAINKPTETTSEDSTVHTVGINGAIGLSVGE